jgi:hypothetical protein
MGLSVNKGGIRSSGSNTFVVGKYAGFAAPALDIGVITAVFDHIARNIHDREWRT